MFGSLLRLVLRLVVLRRLSWNPLARSWLVTSALLSILLRRIVWLLELLRRLLHVLLLPLPKFLADQGDQPARKPQPVELLIGDLHEFIPGGVPVGFEVGDELFEVGARSLHFIGDLGKQLPNERRHTTCILKLAYTIRIDKHTYTSWCHSSFGKTWWNMLCTLPSNPR